MADDDGKIADGKLADDADAQDDAGQNDDGLDDDGQDDWTPPTKADWEKLQASAKLARTEAAQRRKWLAEHGIDVKTGKRSDSAPSPKDVDKAAEEAANALRAAQDSGTRAVKAAAKQALRAAGMTGKSVNLALPQLSLTDLEIDDDGDVLGLDDQIDRLKADYPELFKPADTDRKPATRKTTGGLARKDAEDKPASFAQQLLKSARR